MNPVINFHAEYSATESLVYIYYAQHISKKLEDFKNNISLTLPPFIIQGSWSQ